LCQARLEIGASGRKGHPSGCGGVGCAEARWSEGWRRQRGSNEFGVVRVGPMALAEDIVCASYRTVTDCSIVRPCERWRMRYIGFALMHWADRYE
jgi:hypothetical protein